MSIFWEVLFESLGMNGSNYISWSAHICNVLRTMGPYFERAIKTSILPRYLNNLSNKKKNACCVIVVLLTSCLRAWTKILQILYKRRKNLP